MKSYTDRIWSLKLVPIRPKTPVRRQGNLSIRPLSKRNLLRRPSPTFRCSAGKGEFQRACVGKRRDVILSPFVSVGASLLCSVVARADEMKKEAPAAVEEMKKERSAEVGEMKKEGPAGVGEMKEEAPPAVEEKMEEEEVEITSRIYDATAIGEPLAVGKDKRRVWEKLLNARIVYLGEAEQVPVRDDRDLELEIVKKLRSRCLEQNRPLSLALEAFPSNFQQHLNQFMDGRIDGQSLKSYTSHWPPQRWQEYEPLLSYCRDNGIRLVACGTPLEILRTVQAEGIRGLSTAERKIYAPPAGSGFIAGFTSLTRRSSTDMLFPNQSTPFGPSSYLSAQARVVEDYTMSQIIMKAMLDGGSFGMLIVVTGASHVEYGSRGTGLPARISKKLQKKNQAVILLNPERQDIRREGEVPVADFLWYSAARSCSRNCFDRAEIARVMNAAGRKRDALPQDLQKGLDLGLVSPEVLQNFFDLEQYPLIAQLTHRFQGFRERLLADPKFLHRLAIEEAISITTTLFAQYEKRKENFMEELDYVITDTVRGSVVDFFTVWLPAPTISFLSYADEVSVPEKFELLKGVLGSIPDNAFQENIAGKDWNLIQRVTAVLIGGLKLSGAGFVSSIGAAAVLNVLFSLRRVLKPGLAVEETYKKSPIFKTAVVYAGFLGISANLRYQIIAGLVEHRLSNHLLSSQPVLVNLLSFVVRTVNSYWGTQQWIDLARFTGLQQRNTALTTYLLSDTPRLTLDCSTTDPASVDDQSGDNHTH